MWKSHCLNAKESSHSFDDFIKKRWRCSHSVKRICFVPDMFDEFTATEYAFIIGFVIVGTRICEIPFQSATNQSSLLPS